MLGAFLLNIKKIIYLSDKKKYFRSIVFYSSAAFLDLLALTFVAPLIEIITQTKSKPNNLYLQGFH